MKRHTLALVVLLAVLPTAPASAQVPLVEGRAENVWVFRDGPRVLTYNVGPAWTWTEAGAFMPEPAVIWADPETGDFEFAFFAFAPRPGDVIVPNQISGRAPGNPDLMLPAISFQGASGPTNVAHVPPAERGVTVSPNPVGRTFAEPVRVTLQPFGFSPTARMRWTLSEGGVDRLEGAGPASAGVRLTLVSPSAITLSWTLFEGGVEVLVDSGTWSFSLADSRKDCDNDGIPDLVESQLGLDALTADASRDTDGDGFSNLEELVYGSDFNDPNGKPLDTDLDGTPDAAETHWRLTDPNMKDSRPAAIGPWGVESFDTLFPVVPQGVVLNGAGRYELTDLGGRNLDFRGIDGYPFDPTGPLFPLPDEGGPRQVRYPLEAARHLAAIRVLPTTPARESAALSRLIPGLGTFTPLDAARDVAAQGLSWNNLNQFRTRLRNSLRTRLLVGSDAPPERLLTVDTTRQAALLQSLLAWAKGPDGTLALLGSRDNLPGLDALSALLEATDEDTDSLLTLVQTIDQEPALMAWRATVEAHFSLALGDDPELDARFDHLLAIDLSRGTGGADLARDVARLIARVGLDRLAALGDARPLALDTSADFDGDGLSTSAELAGPAAITTDPLLADTDGDSYVDGFDACGLNPDLTCCIEWACNFDLDRDDVPDASDNCPGVANPGQADSDGDGRGDACEMASIARPLGEIRVRVGASVAFKAARQPAPDPNTYRFRRGTDLVHGAEATFTFPEVGVFTVTLEVPSFVEDDQGSWVPFTFTDSRMVYVYPALPDTLAATLSAPTSLTEGEVGTFTVTPTASALNATASWTFSDGPTASGLTVTRSFAQEGTFFASVTVTDGYSRTLTLEHRVDVTDSSPTAAFDYEINGFTLTLTDESAAFDGIASRRFSIPGTAFESTDPVTVFDLAGPGSYLVRVDVTDGDGSSDRHEELVVVDGLVCAGGCDDGIACTVDACDPLTGQCVHTPDNCINDRDGDAVPDGSDNCPDLPNPDQANFDGDGFGDACDPDDDNDGAPDTTDNCAFLANPGQQDVDLDGLGDSCDSDIDNDLLANHADNCPFIANADQADSEADGAGDVCDTDDDNDGAEDPSDNCPLVGNADQSDLDGDGDGDACDADKDGDGLGNDDDNCPGDTNPGQADADGDGQGDVCDSDDDNDGVSDETDNCRFAYNPEQLDTDADLQGDACDNNDDNDAWVDAQDNCPVTHQPNQADADGDGRGDACDDDVDGDGLLNDADNCPVDANAPQLDTDNDGAGDACDLDDDGDGVEDIDDNCPLVANGQDDVDQDMIGDACDDDIDGDGIPNAVDNCLRIANPSQSDTDTDGQGDTCDADDDGDGSQDTEDNCPLIANAAQADQDDDSIGDVCDDDLDGDGWPNGNDNCATLANADQANLDGDTQGDVCDPDIDGDGWPNADDNCPRLAWPSQANLDGDTQGDACDDDLDGDGIPNNFDNCVALANPAQADLDQDMIGDACDDDRDGDGWPNGDDNCPDLANTLQADYDGDGVGDACEDDLDGDGVADATDNCPFVPNPDQLNRDQDSHGDVCDPDLDGDGIPNGQDNCAQIPNAAQTDTDGDGLGDACDGDDDLDGFPDGADNCPRHANPGQEDLDTDGIGDACDSDRDGDGVFDVADNCPAAANADQRDLDGDWIGDACDGDLDGDGIANADDLCPEVADPEQLDSDGDGLGDACDNDDDNDGVSDANDQCPDTGLAIVDPNTGCSIEQLCPCAGPRGTTDEWRSHDKYVSCVTQAARRFARQGLITSAEQNTLIVAADQSDCGYLRCNGRLLTANPAATGPFLVLTIPGYQPLGQAPAAPLVYAGTTRVFPDATGRYVVPFRAAGGAILVDALQPNDLKRSSVPAGAIVVLRGGAGNYALGLNGGLSSRSTLGVSVVSRVQSGQRANERDLSFERHGDGLWTLGDVRQDEFVSTSTETTLHMTEGSGHDLLSGRLCQ